MSRTADQDPAEESLFADEPEDVAETSPRDVVRPVWRVLIADDDVEVHRATEFALWGAEIEGRRLELLHANNATETLRLLREQADMAVAMLDVVMETPDAGLKVAEAIRNELHLESLRIVLRTGQPGYAPELDVIRRYDINDYRTKGELSQTRLLTTLTAAIRAYRQLELINAANRGMETVARASNEIFRLRSTKDFSRTLLDRVAELLDRPVDGLVCVEQPRSLLQREPGLYIEHAVGHYSAKLGCQVSQSLDVELQRSIQRSLAARSSVFETSRVVMWLGNGTRDAVAVIDLTESLQQLELRLVTMFAASLSVGFENVDLIERLDFFAFHDPLTHLPNRTRFINDVDQDLFAHQGRTRSLAMADIVRFSDINDALGHRSGDSLLVAVGKRLRATLGAAVTVSRLSGDMFGLYGPESSMDPHVIKKAFDSPFFIHGHALSVQLRLGIVHLRTCRGNAVELLRNANLALNCAHKLGGAVSCEFSTAMSEDVHTRVSMLHSLRAAIDFKRGLSLVYQPVINAATGRVIATEALLRWRNEFGEVIPPMRFIPLAEQTGMIHELGLWVIEQALDQLASWHRHGLEDLTMTINLSAVQFRAEDFVDKVRNIVEYCDINPTLICLEVTEAIGLEAPSLLDRQFDRLRDMGIRIAVDDFGTGQSSLQQLLGMSFDVVKLAPGFVQQIGSGESGRRVVTSILALAGKCAGMVVAEGVESPEQASALLESGCKYMQGFHFAKPMTAELFTTWVASGSEKKG